MTAAQQLTDQEIGQRLQNTTRQFSDQELNNSEDLLVDLGVVIDRSEAAVGNTNIILGYFDKQRHVPMNPVNIKAVVKVYAEKLVWVSQAAKRYFLLGLTPSETSLLNGWFEQGPGRLLIGEGEQGRENTVALVNYCRKVGGINWGNLSNGLEALNPVYPVANAVALHWKTATSQDGFTNRTGLPNHAENSTPEAKQEQTRQYVGGRKNHAYKDPNAPTTPVQVDPNEGGGWRQVCEALARDGSHADQAELSQVLARARAEGKSWLDTYSVMQQVKKDRHGFRSFDRKGL